MSELTVQKVYDILKERIAIIHHALSENSNFKITSKKLRKSLTDAEAELQNYIDNIDSHPDEYKEELADTALSEFYFTKLCPDKKE